MVVNVRSEMGVEGITMPHPNPLPRISSAHAAYSASEGDRGGLVEVPGACDGLVAVPISVHFFDHASVQMNQAKTFRDRPIPVSLEVDENPARLHQPFLHLQKICSLHASEFDK